MSLFTDLFSNDFPTIFLGDFNWQMNRPSSCSTLDSATTCDGVSVNDCNISPGGSTASLL